MSALDDHSGEMNTHRALDDTAAEAVLTGRAVADPDLDSVAALLTEVRALVREAPPAPSAALAAILAGEPVREAVLSLAQPGGRTTATGGPAQRPGVPRPNVLSRLLRNVAAAGLTAKIALGAGVAAASVTGAAAAGVLPGPVQDAVADAVGAVTPFELPRRADTSAEPGDGGISDAPGAPTTGHPASADDAPVPNDTPAAEAPYAPDAGVAGIAGVPRATDAGSPITTPGPTPTTSPPPSDPRPPEAGDPPAAQPDPAPTTPEPAPAAPEPTAANQTPAPAPAGSPTADAPIPVKTETDYDVPDTPPDVRPLSR